MYKREWDIAVQKMDREKSGESIRQKGLICCASLCAWVLEWLIPLFLETSLKM